VSKIGLEENVNNAHQGQGFINQAVAIVNVPVLHTLQEFHGEKEQEAISKVGILEEKLATCPTKEAETSKRKGGRLIEAHHGVWNSRTILHNPSHHPP